MSVIIITMIELNIPGRGVLKIQHLVSDVNGTLAVDGVLIEGVAERIAALRDKVEIHLLTADTHGRQKIIDQQLNLTATKLTPGGEQAQKQDYVNKLGTDSVIAVGQGANDAGMLEAAAIGICVMSAEGVAKETLLAADLVAPDIQTVFDLLEKPIRIAASLRK